MEHRALCGGVHRHLALGEPGDDRVVGAPPGFIAGRSAWRVVAEHTPIVLVIPTLDLALVLVVPAALLAADLAGLRPAWRVAHSSPVERLRAD